MVNAAGLAVLVLGLTAILPVLAAFLFPFGAPAAGPLPNGWELVVLAAGCGLVAYGAVDRAPGPAYLGVANLAVFLVSAAVSDEDTLLYWPALILAARARHDVRRPAPARAAPARAAAPTRPATSRSPRAAARTSRCCACAMIRHRR